MIHFIVEFPYHNNEARTTTIDENLKYRLE